MNKIKTTLLLLILISLLQAIGMESCEELNSSPQSPEPEESWANLYENSLREGGEARIRFEMIDYIVITKSVKGKDRQVLIEKIDPEDKDKYLFRRMFPRAKAGEERKLTMQERVNFRLNNPTFTIENKISGGFDVMGCQRRGSEYYIAKDYYDLERICGSQSDNPVKKFEGSLKELFPTCSEDWIEGSYGQIKKCNLVMDGIQQEVAIKKIDQIKFNLVELYAYLKIEELKNGVRFFGCEIEKIEESVQIKKSEEIQEGAKISETEQANNIYAIQKTYIYYAQDYMEIDLDSEVYRTRYMTMEFNEKIDEWLKVCDIVDNFHVTNLVHNDVKPTNIMVFNNNFKLIDFGFAQLDGSFIDELRIQITRPFGSARKFEFKTHAKFNDIYGIIMTIVSMHGGGGEDQFFLDQKDQKELIDPECFESWPDKCDDIMQNVILRIMKKDFGEYIETAETDPNKINLTTLFIKLFRYTLKINSAKELRSLLEKVKKPIVV